MLGSYMEDIGITPEQFEAACQMSKDGGGLPLHFHQRLFEQIWAANDYNIFTRMMTQRNVELQIQALELIEQRSGMVPHSYQQDVPGESSPTTDDHDAIIMEEVKKLSLEEPDPIGDEHQVIAPTSVEEIQQEKISLMSALDTFQKHVVLKEIKENNEAKSEDMKQERRKMKEFIQENEAPVPAKPLKEDVEQRQLYLKQQRDKLLAMKKQIREKQLADSDGDSSLMRPKSSKSAMRVLSGDTIKPQDSSLQLRKALADRLRTEVVEKY